MERSHLALLVPLLAFATAQTPPSSRAAGTQSRPESRPYAELAKLRKPKEGSARVYLARHGQSVGNATFDDSKLSEKEKDKLSELGRKEGARLGDAVALADVHQLYTSPAARAKETAELAAERAKVGNPLRETAAVRPLVPGKTPAAGGSAYAWLVERWRAGEDRKLEGGETLAELCQRLKEGAIELRKLGLTAKAPVFAVAHSEVLLAYLAGFDPVELRKQLVTFGVRNGAVMAFDVGDGGAVEFLGYFVPPQAQ
jgi:broad specificity phosphatase PhoE